MRAELVRRQKLLDQVLQACDKWREGGIAACLTVDAYALVDSLEVRRRVQTGTKSRAPKDGFQKSRRRAFAVGSGNVRAGVSAVRTPESFRKNSNIFEVELRRRSLCGRSQLFA